VEKRGGSIPGNGILRSICEPVGEKHWDHGLWAISGNHYDGDHLNMGKEAEAKILEPFKARAEKGEKVEISEIAEAYQAAVDHPVGGGQICCVLKRHGWRKAMPKGSATSKAAIGYEYEYCSKLFALEKKFAEMSNNA